MMYTALNDELQDMLDKAVAHIIEKGTVETASGNYIIDSDDIPHDVLSPKLFTEHIDRLSEMLLDYGAVAEAEVCAGKTIDIIFYLDYCPNYEPTPDEADVYPPDRPILDPLQTKNAPKHDELLPESPPSKPTLAERLEENKRKAAKAPSTPRKVKEPEV